MKKLEYVDSLRGIAIILVIMVHCSQYGNYHVANMLNKAVIQGARGVQLFFVASAFTLFLSHRKRKNKEISPNKNFFMRRFFRIAPMYYIGIIYYLFQNGLTPANTLGDAKSISIFNILSNFTFTHGINPYWINSLVPGGWSITVEVTFYAILPILFIAIKNINGALNFFSISLIFKLALEKLFSIYTPVPPNLWTDYLFFYFPSQLPVFALGIIMYFIIEKHQEAPVQLSGKSLLGIASILFLQITFNYNLILANQVIYGIAFMILGIALSRYQPSFLVNPITRFIGKLSFSLYLVHFAVLYWLEKLGFINYFANGNMNYITRFIIVTILATGVAYIFYNLIELPFQKLGKKIIDSSKDRKDLDIVTVNN